MLPALHEHVGEDGVNGSLHLFDHWSLLAVGEVAAGLEELGTDPEAVGVLGSPLEVVDGLACNPLHVFGVLLSAGEAEVEVEDLAVELLVVLDLLEEGAQREDGAD